MAQVKTVYPTSEIAHLWAHQTQRSARNPQGNFYFQGDVIYSYGEHFPIARIRHNGKKKMVMITTRTFSSMTSGHTAAVRMACKHLPTFDVDDVMHWDVLGALRRQARETWKFVQCGTQRLFGCTAKMFNFRRYRYLEKQFNACLKFFNMTGQIKRPRDYEVQRRNAIQGERVARIRYRAKMEKKKAAVKAEEESRKKKFEEVLPQWTNGEVTTRALPQGNYPVYFRLHPHSDKIETSLGAFLSVEEALAIWPKVKEARRSGINWTSGGRYPEELKVGAYQVDRIDYTGDVHAGCHHVKWAQVKMLAIMLGVLNAKTKNKRGTARKTRQIAAK